MTRNFGITTDVNAPPRLILHQLTGNVLTSLPFRRGYLGITFPVTVSRVGIGGRRRGVGHARRRHNTFPSLEKEKQALSTRCHS